MTAAGFCVSKEPSSPLGPPVVTGGWMDCSLWVQTNMTTNIPDRILVRLVAIEVYVATQLGA